jgi:hypothetical protein
MDAQDKSLMPTPLHSQRHRAEQVRLRRYEPTPVYVLAEHLKREGVELHKVHGPWHPIRRSLRRLGRNAQQAIPIVTNGATELAVDTAERAERRLRTSQLVRRRSPRACPEPPSARSRPGSRLSRHAPQLQALPP